MGKTRSKFILMSNEEEEKAFICNLNCLNRINIKLEKLILSLTPNVTRENLNVVWVCILKCKIAIDSVICLLKNGFEGSARAIFRQIYEFVLIGKVALIDPNSAIVSQFFKSNKEEKCKCDIVDYIKKNYKLSSLSELEKNYIDWGKDIYIYFCSSTHASNYAQQNIVPIDNFYNVLKGTVKELYGLEEGLLKLASAFADEAVRSYLGDDIFVQGKLSYICRELQELLYSIDKRLSVIDTTKKEEMVPIFASCIESKWIIKNKNEIEISKLQMRNEKILQEYKQNFQKIAIKLKENKDGE